MRLQGQGLHFGIGDRFAGQVEGVKQESGDGQPGGGGGGTDELQNRVESAQRRPGPGNADLGKQAVLDGIILGTPGWEMANGDTQPQPITQLVLDLVFPASGTTAVTPTGISQNQKLVSRWVGSFTFREPPPRDGFDGKFGGIGGQSDIDGATIASHIINPIRDGATLGITWEIMRVDHLWRLTPIPALVLEITNQFFLFGIDTDDWPLLGLKFLVLVANILKLCFSLRMVLTPFFLFEVGFGRIVQLFQDSSHRRRTYFLAHLLQLNPDPP